MTFDAICQVLIIWLMILLKRQGHAIKNKYLLDNPSHGAVRHIVNNTFDRPYITETQHEQKKLVGLLPRLLKKVSKTDEAKKRHIKMDHIISYIRTERIIHTQDIEFLRNLKKICLL